MIDEAVAVLRRGGLVAFPTETVFGLGANAEDPEAVARIFAAKGRPPGRALTIHLGPHTDPARWAVWTEDADRLAKAFWPGPLTIILRRTSRVPDIVTGGQDTVGLRVPAHPVSIALLDAFGGGVAAPSANRTGQLSPTRAEHVRADLGDAVDVILEGRCDVGVESTVLSLVGPPTVLRAGAVGVEALEALLGCAVRTVVDTDAHYAPRTPLEVRADVSGATGAVLSRIRPERASFWIPAPETAEAYAQALYGNLRALDEAGCERIVVEAIPSGGLWDAVSSRLEAAERSSTR